MAGERKHKIFPVAVIVTALGLASMVFIPTSGAQSVSVGGNTASGSNSGSVGGSLGSSGGTGTASVGGPSETTSNSRLSIGSGSGTASSSSGTVQGTRTNFTSSFNQNSSSSSINLGNGDTAIGTNLGLPGTAGSGTVPDGEPNPGSIAAVIGSLSPQEQRKLTEKCVSILTAPQRYSLDMVAVCKVLASL